MAQKCIECYSREYITWIANLKIKKISLLAWCMMYYNSRVYFDCGRPVQFKQFE